VAGSALVDGRLDYEFRVRIIAAEYVFGAADSETAERGAFAFVERFAGKLLKDHYELAMKTIGSGIALEQNRISDALNFAKAAVSLLNKNTVKEIRFAVYNHLAAVYSIPKRSFCIRIFSRFRQE